MATVLGRTTTKQAANGKAPRAPRLKPRPTKATSVVSKPLLTAEEYFATCDIKNTELINGKVVKLMPTGFDHGETAIAIASEIRAFARKHKIGRVSVEGGFTVRRNPDTVRGPDVSYVSYERLGDQSTHAFIEGTPNLAIEVNSPSDTWSEVEEKVQLYLAGGSEMVWVVDPKTQTVTVRTQSATRVYDKRSTLSADPVLPGFKLSLKEIFSD